MSLEERRRTKKDAEEARLISVYLQLRAHLEHEDGLVHQRLTWLLTSQSFLFAAVAFLFSRLQDLGDIQKVLGIGLITLISIIGILLTRVVRSSVMAAYNSIRMLKDVWATHFGAYQEGDEREPDESKFSVYWPFDQLVNLMAQTGDSESHNNLDMRVSKGRFLFLTGGGHPNAGRLHLTGSIAIPNIFLFGWTILLSVSFVALISQATFVLACLFEWD